MSRLHALPLLLLGCLAGRDRAPHSEAPSPMSPTPTSVEWRAPDEGEQGLVYTLKDGSPAGPEGDRATLAVAADLPAATTEALLARVPALELEAGDQQAFALRKASTPPPRAGETVAAAWPPPEGPAPPDPEEAGPLRVLRFQPEGEVELAPHLSITFSQPMVAVGSQAEASDTRPVKLRPEPPGTWRWVGTKTLLFQPTGRFPMATDYTLEVAAGTTSATGGRLEQGHSSRFSTPPPRAVQYGPVDGPHGLEPVIWIEFDQKVDPAQVLPRLKLRASGEYALRLLTEAEREQQPAHLRQPAHPDRLVLVRPVQPLPRATTFTLSVEKGTPSLEGPRTTTTVQSFSFRTYEPLQVREWGCGWRQRTDCPPNGGFQVRFNNPLDATAFDPQSVQIAPALEPQSVSVSGDTVLVYGSGTGRTTYTIRLPAGLKDQFGQTLGNWPALEVRTGDAWPELQGPGKDMVVLDPTAEPTLSVFSVNHKKLRVEVRRVGPEHWDRLGEWNEKHRWETRTPGPLPGALLKDEVITVGGTLDRMTETTIDLRPYLKDGKGQLLVRVRPTPLTDENRWQDVIVWVQATEIGLTAVNDYEELVVWASSLKDGAPLAEVQTSVLGDEAAAGATGADGLARLTMPPTGQLLVARKGEDLALLPQGLTWQYRWNTWSRSEPNPHPTWFVFDDRGMYRPKEEVRIKGWVRRLDPRKRGDIGLLDPPMRELSWELYDARGVKLLEGRTRLSALGGFDLALKLPDTPNLGYAQLYLRAEDGSATTHGFQIQEFRRPEFEVSATAPTGPIVLGERATASVRAAYYAGGGLPSAETTWTVSASPAWYTPPDRAEYTFGTWVPWWRHLDDEGGASTSQSLTGKTDPLGQHHLELHFLSTRPARPWTVQANATVYDVNRQAWSSSASMLVHPSAAYVGLKTKKTVVEKGEDIDVDVVVVDIDGKLLPGRTAELVMTRLVLETVGGAWQEVEKDPQRCTAEQGKEPARCRFQPKHGGAYKILARVKDEQGRPNESDLRFWVPGGDQKPARDVQQEELVLVPDRRDPAPGETVKILVNAPFFPAEGLMTVARSGILRQERFTLSGPSAVLELPILEEHIPDVTVEVQVVGSAVRSDDKGEARPDLPRRVAYASGALTFRVPTARRALTVQVSPRDKALAPGGATRLSILVQDADGRPVPGAELAVVVADESVLALSGYTTPDPLAAFYTARGSGIATHHQRAAVTLANPLSLRPQAVPTGGPPGANGFGGLGLRGMGSGGGGDMDMLAPAPAAAPMEMEAASATLSKEKKSEAPARSRSSRSEELADITSEPSPDASGGPIAERKNFDALALFAPEVPTDKAGRAELELPLPDSLTRYRVMVVAVAGGTQFGAGESAVTVRQPLMLRPSPPRFLNFGDQFELPLVLQNQTDAPMTVDVALRAANATLVAKVEPELPTAAPRPVSTWGKRVTVPANDRVEVRFPAVAQQAGTARFQAVASTGGASDATRFELPVWTPATTEAFATYGELDQGHAVQPVRAPGEVWSQFGGLEVSTSSTELQSLTDAFLYLVQYPFDCNEQIASRLLAIVALRDVLQAFQVEGMPDEAALRRFLDEDIHRLARRQNHDGGFAFWRKGDPSWPWLSIHGAHAFARARQKGYEVPADAWSRSQHHLRNIERYIPHWYGEEARRGLRAYALYVRHRMGDADPQKAQALFKEKAVEAHGLETLAFLLPTLHEGGQKASVEAILRHLGNRAVEEAGTAHFATSYGDQGHVLLHSDRRVDALLLEALLEVRPDEDLLPKLVRGLQAHRVKGRWSSTQENAFVLLALDAYFRKKEGITPNYMAKLWLGEGWLGEHAFRGRTTERFQAEVPMSYLADGPAEQDLTIAKDGPGRLYYRIGMRYAPRSLVLEPAEHGFTVERTYEAVDRPEDVRRDEDGVWHIRAGAKVKVTVTMVAVGRRYHVALVDPIPAGLEPINPALAVSEPVATNNPPESLGRYWWWGRPWYEHQNMRDERVEAFTSLLWEGVHTYSYTARATTPGRYIVPPPKAEEMYQPETFGRGRTDRVVVE